MPSVAGCRGAHELIALSIRDDFGGIQSLAQVINKGTLIAVKGLYHSRKHLGRFNTFVLQSGETTGEYSFSDECEGLSFIKSCNSCPFPRAFLTGCIQNQIHNFITLFVFISENVPRDLNEIRIEFALIPFSKDFVHLLIRHSQTGTHEMVAFADHLHITVFNAIMDHFHKMTGAIFAHPITAGFPFVRLGTNGLENFFHFRPGAGGTAGHHGGPEKSPFFST